ncbi:hypothetical protein HYH03_016377 [Edaphochlamys debaryana]|uniref:Glycosyl transferase CAP10 domain-containing protein n=1 Tax=Edaphochlamys debaryana TaxID=47281 RepID=A0A835XMG1_9CHLO|nr:hypothetical protein HYH03_016377 [Edaphochlamys debaryana]|eukprot:KAG2484896.1 hypothetical protein HYH03_016377 [Edaphochlamys debaryana]
MDWMLEHWHAFPWRNKGVGIAFVKGKPFIVTDASAFDEVGHHKRLIVAHLALFEALSATFGEAIPDVEFLVSTADEPVVLTTKYATRGSNRDPPGIPPVLRFCKSDSFADILVPDIHFFSRNFTHSLLHSADAFNSAWPWAKKKAGLFGRFSPYVRAVNMHAPELFREGKEGRNICVTANPSLLGCDVRKHYIWQYARGAKRSGLPVDVAQQPKKDMLYHASHKYLLHLDGQSCSSRLEQLLVLGSAVVKEESGYRAFFHHLLQPYKHYIPFWKKRPEETADALAWAAEHDDEAAQIAARAQRFALQYLHRRALMCYWLTLLKELSPLLRYKVGPEAGNRTFPHWTPVEEYMQAEGGKELRKHHMSAMEFWD